MNEFEPKQQRSDARQFVAMIVITVATAMGLGITLRQPTLMAANDISRWCTVWSLLERGSYIIDECPWQLETQDKVFRAPKRSSGGSAGQEPVKHYYSSKPALLPTLIAGILYPVRQLTGVPLDRVVLQQRAPRWTQKPDADAPGKAKGVLETPADPVKWPAYIFYFKPILILLNVIPFCVFLILFTRLLDDYAANDWAWLFGLTAAAFGTYLLPFSQTLNNHTVAAYSTFFALYQFVRISDECRLSGWRFALAGFFASFAATNELPALAFLAILFCLLAVRDFRRTVLFFIPAAIFPIAGFAAAQYAVFGEVKLAYEAFGSDEYLYEGSLWKTPLDLDALNENPEPYGVYLFHLILGHHGIFSLTPVFLFSALGAIRLLKRGGTPLGAVAWMTTVLTVVMVAFYTWNPKARNYGGMTQGLRWLFWLIPLWLVLLPRGVEGGQSRYWGRCVMLVALAISAISVGYAMRNPWSHPWILDALEHLNLYSLKR